MLIYNKLKPEAITQHRQPFYSCPIRQKKAGYKDKGEEQDFNIIIYILSQNEHTSNHSGVMEQKSNKKDERRQIRPHHYALKCIHFETKL